MKPKNQLIRIVKNKEKEVEIDLTGKKSGRGAYICANDDCLQKAIKNRGLQRSFKGEVPKELIGRLQKEMGEKL